MKPEPRASTKAEDLVQLLCSQAAAFGSCDETTGSSTGRDMDAVREELLCYIAGLEARVSHLTREAIDIVIR